MHSKHFLSNTCGLLFSLDSLRRLKNQPQSQVTVLGDAEVQRHQVSQDELLFRKKPVPSDLLNNNEGIGSELSTQSTTAIPSTSLYDSALEAEEFSRMLDGKFGAYLGETTEVETAISLILANESIERRLHLGNLAYTTTEENIKDFFRGNEL
jgi:hypothetical protein